MSNYNISGGDKSKERSSNLELLRIIAMFSIVAHHSVVNSGIADSFSFIGLNPNMIFLQLWGMWGKTAINVFVMITGYFMCTSRLTWKRFAKIYMEAKFYRILFFIVFLIMGYEVISAKSLLKILFGYIYNINNGFTSSFFAFYLFIPFYNVMIEKIGKDLWKLVASLLALFTVASTFFFNSFIFHYVFWYMTLYFTAAGFRLYPNKWTESKRFTGIFLVISVILSYTSVITVDVLGHVVKLDKQWMLSYYFVSDSNKLLAFMVGVSAFLFFKNIHVRQSKIINRIAATTFGVLCIHANSDTMRQWLWSDLLNVPAMFNMPIIKLIITELVMSVAIFIICSLIDMARISLIENLCLLGLITTQRKLKIEARTF